MAEPSTQAPPESVPGTGVVIAATKLHIPTARKGTVPRRDLVEALVAGSDRKLALLAAPPGAGKTTLLSEWHSSRDEDRPFAWLSLDRADNDPVRFWSGVVEALRTVEPGLGASALATLPMTNVSVVEVVLPTLINELTALGRSIVLVLDDYHLITESAIHDSVAALLERLPATVHLALATRADPPLPLARYRARGEMAEIRAPQLRFSEAEAAALLNDVLGLDLDHESVARLQRRTEGWAAGLYLAALSLRGRTDVESFIASFAGDDRQIVDYLASEVLAAQPTALREFMLRTSVLERLSGPLCDAVTGEEDSARTLERMERSNLFLVPLDHKRTWYRYHQLFAELLRTELALADPESVAELHRNAYRWYREQESIPDAIHHALAAGDAGPARELIARHWREFFDGGRLGTVERWLDALPADDVRSDPRLCTARAWLSLDRGRPDEAVRWIEAAEAAIASGGDGADSTESEVAVLRAVRGFKMGDLGACQEAAGQVLELEPEGLSPSRFVAHCMLGISRYWRGEADAADAPLREAVELAHASRNDLGESYARGYLALVEAEAGALAEAEHLAGLATELGDDPGVAEHFVTMIGHLAAARVAEQAGRLEDAESQLRRAVALSERGAGSLEIAFSRLALARVRRSHGDREGAERLLREARRTIDRCPDPGTLAAALSAAGRGKRAGPVPGAPLEELTDRELAVLRLLRSDLSRREIGEALYVSQNTVKTHVRGIYRKLDASTREQAVARARELGFL